MDDRIQRLGQHSAQTAPAWAITALGLVPTDPAARSDWARRAASIAAYREMYSYEHLGDPIGPEPGHQAPDQRSAWYQAFTTLGRANGLDVRAMPDGRLWLLRDTYAAQTAWAPRYTGKRAAALPARRLRRRPRHHPRRRRSPGCRKAGDHDRTARHEHLAASYRAMRDHYQQQQALAQVMAAREEWEQATAGSRRLAIAADAATPIRRSSRFALPSPHLSAIPNTSRPTLRPARKSAR